jgi:hypothetical protein
MDIADPKRFPPSIVVPDSLTVARCMDCLQDPLTERYLLSDYVPVRHFGRLQSAKAVTVGINPASNESGKQAIPLVSGFGISRRSQLHDNDLVSISKFQDTYFDQGKAHAFFDKNFYFVLHSIDESWTYQSGNVAHIDVVFCATDPLWSKLGRDKKAQASIRRNCRPHYFRTLELIPSGTWLLWGGQEAANALGELNPWISSTGVTTVKQVAWKMGNIELKGNTYPFIAWNKVGAGMSNNDRCELGEIVKQRIRFGVLPTRS